MSKKLASKKFTTVSIPKTLVNNVKNKIKGTRFQSPSAFVTYVLEELEKEIEKGSKKGKGDADG
ncbi:MAG TPA: hypothetical protein VKM55_22580 [Candidatus Lokiarchaeia archaeon]|nr:hypothetical protein [Candidatus Lokiarchaeia archaeon]